MKIRLGFGLVNYPFEDGKGFFRWVEMLEAARVDSVWQSDRLISTDNYLESLAALASLAGCTERIKFGMNAIVAPLRDPLVLAKQCATIDYLSGGRLLAMFGVGYPRAAEWAATGRDSTHRGSQANEMFELLTRLWSEESVTYEGRYYQYRDAASPRVRSAPLPLWIGGNSDAAIRRTARLGTGWIVVSHRRTRSPASSPGSRPRPRASGARSTTITMARRSPIASARADAAVVHSPFVKRTGIGEVVDLIRCSASAARLISWPLARVHRGGCLEVRALPIAAGEADMRQQTRLVIDEVKPRSRTEAGAGLATPAATAGEPRTRCWSGPQRRGGRSLLRGRASLTRAVRPLSMAPFNSAMAASPSLAFGISTKPNPFERPVSRSMTIFALVTSPCCSNASRSSSVVMS